MLEVVVVVVVVVLVLVVSVVEVGGGISRDNTVGQAARAFAALGLPLSIPSTRVLYSSTRT